MLQNIAKKPISPISTLKNSVFLKIHHSMAPQKMKNTDCTRTNAPTMRVRLGKKRPIKRFTRKNAICLAIYSTFLSSAFVYGFSKIEKHREFFNATMGD